MRAVTVKKLRRLMRERILKGEKFKSGTLFGIRYNEYKNAMRTLKREWKEGLWK